MKAVPPRLGGLRARVELTLAAFVPAFGLLAARMYGTWWFWFFMILTALGLLFVLVLIAMVRSGNREPFSVETVEDRGDEVLGHIGAYLLPLVLDPSSGSRQVVITVLVLALILHIHVATGRVHVSPLLYLLGRRVHTAVTGGQTYYVVSRSDPAGWGRRPPLFVPVGASLLVEVRGKGAGRRR